MTTLIKCTEQLFLKPAVMHRAFHFIEKWVQQNSGKFGFGMVHNVPRV